MKNYARLVDGNLEVANINEGNESQLLEITNEGFKEYIITEKPDTTLSLYQAYKSIYTENEDSISLSWELEDDSVTQILPEMKRLQKLLSASDYREWRGMATDEELAERESWRDQIRSLEARSPAAAQAFEEWKIK